jgi:hypothetical protein
MIKVKSSKFRGSAKLLQVFAVFTLVVLFLGGISTMRFAIARGPSCTTSSSSSSSPCSAAVDAVHLSPTALTHVVMPLFDGQIDRVEANLASWETQYPPCAATAAAATSRVRPTLVLYLSTPTTTRDEDAVRRSLLTASSTAAVSRCFGGVVIASVSSDNSHKTGARLMFEHMINKRVEALRDARSVLYMEPDMLPIRAGWLTALEKDAEKGGEFWVKGSLLMGDYNATRPYLKKRKFYKAVLYHINGNALYFLGDGRFAAFYNDDVRPFVVRKHGDSVGGYDTDIWEYLFDPDNFDQARTLLRYYVYTPHDLAKTYPGAVLVHGGYPNKTTTGTAPLTPGVTTA